MRNIFPIAEEVIIEEIVGSKRQSIKIPYDIECKLSNNNINNININSNTDINNINYNNINSDIINLYTNKNDNISISEVYNIIHKYNISLYECIKIYDYLEENKYINYNNIIKKDINKCKEILHDNSNNINNINSNNITNNNISNDYTHKYYNERYIEPSHLHLVRCGKCMDSSATAFTSGFDFYCDSCGEGTASKLHRITERLTNSMWSKKDEYMLLKGIEIYKDNWDKVEEYVNTNINLNNSNITNNSNINSNTNNNFIKSKEMCIFHFINMCILERIDEYYTLPFTHFKNQITPLIAFIASIDPSLSVKLVKKFFKLINSNLNNTDNANSNLNNIDNANNINTQADVCKELLGDVKSLAIDLIKNKRDKVERLREVRVEAYIKRMDIKMQTIESMYMQPEQIKEELMEKREHLIAELAAINGNKI